MFALIELWQTLHAALCEALRVAWQAADLRGRLGEWWWVMTHRHLLDSPPPLQEAADAG
jgi:hypothetical protein